MPGAVLQIRRELAPHFGPKNAGIRSKISKKVRYHLQSSELGLRKTNENKKPPRTGRFFINSAHTSRKNNTAGFSVKKNPTGGQLHKKTHRRERRIRNPRTQTPVRCQTHSPKLAGRLHKNNYNRIERRRLNPGGSNRWRTIQF